MQNKTAITIPTEQECERLLTEVFNISENELNNARLVKTVAMRIGRDLKWLRDRGPNLNLIKAGSILSAITIGSNKEAKEECAKLKELGYPEIAEIADINNYLDFSDDFTVSEKGIIFIADKLVDDEELVSVVYKYDYAIENVKNDPLKVADLERKKIIALKIKSAIERETGKNLEELAIADND
ncbi:metal-dependent phosphohydrolase [Maridesulfovibrio frigidus]|uniref:metal-dependent phosphohydrolase n=1 Tax=Maridesulfovibrio frigidus TaxID=340956 RepID=UPI000B198683|nr:metal-dependent phosphohydrolase [Maridesulfovibrio frigidus]